jgi:hypothetical protein
MLETRCFKAFAGRFVAQFVLSNQPQSVTG